MRRVVLITVAAALIGVAPAEAKLVTKPKCDSLKCRLASQTKNLKHVTYVCRNGKNDARMWSCSAMSWLKKERNETVAKLAILARPPHYEQWMCIHRYEGSWTDPNAPFWGGLQMDESFQKAYGL